MSWPHCCCPVYLHNATGRGGRPGSQLCSSRDLSWTSCYKPIANSSASCFGERMWPLHAPWSWGPGLSLGVAQHPVILSKSRNLLVPKKMNVKCSDASALCSVSLLAGDEEEPCAVYRLQ